RSRRFPGTTLRRTASGFVRRTSGTNRPPTSRPSSHCRVLSFRVVPSLSLSRLVKGGGGSGRNHRPPVRRRVVHVHRAVRYEEHPALSLQRLLVAAAIGIVDLRFDNLAFRRRLILNSRPS